MPLVSYEGTNTGLFPIPWPSVHRGEPHFINHPEEGLMKIRECAVQGEDGEGSWVSELKIFSNEVGSRKQCGQTLA